MASPFCHPHRVTYAECTVGNHVYHARYLDFLEAARGEFLRALGAPVEFWQARDVIFPVIEARVCYRAPARYDDLLAIQVWPALIRGVRVNFGHRIVNQAGTLILEAETFHACTSAGEKPRRVPPELVALLAAHLPPTTPVEKPHAD
jgi:acyl-CoA thioester hydrolase